jgi:hypothetical protein
MEKDFEEGMNMKGIGATKKVRRQLFLNIYQLSMGSEKSIRKAYSNPSGRETDSYGTCFPS